MAKQFSGAFKGYKLSITESHQSTKADTSGTAKALAADFSKLTAAPFDVESEISMIRDAEGQKVSRTSCLPASTIVHTHQMAPASQVFRLE